jgi:hypothetical protein
MGPLEIKEEVEGVSAGRASILPRGYLFFLYPNNFNKILIFCEYTGRGVDKRYVI